MRIELHKNSILIGFIAPILFSVSAAEAQQSDGSQIVIRDEPFGSAEILATVDAISNSQIIDDIPYYLHVSFGDGQSGFVRKDDLINSGRHTDIARRNAGRAVEASELADLQNTTENDVAAVALAASSTPELIAPAENVSSRVRV